MYMYYHISEIARVSNSWKFFKESRVIYLFMPKGIKGKKYEPIYDFYEEITDEQARW